VRRLSGIFACFVAANVACACGGGSASDATPDLACHASNAQVDQHVSIATGLYGRVYAASPASIPSPDWCGQGYTIAAFDRADATLMNVLGQSTSDSGGFFEISLDPGTYQLCVITGDTSDCIDAAVPASGRARHDLAIGTSGEHWQ
jgi:hypothetical protein